MLKTLVVHRRLARMSRSNSDSSLLLSDNTTKANQLGLLKPNSCLDNIQGPNLPNTQQAKQTKQESSSSEQDSLNQQTTQHGFHSDNRMTGGANEANTQYTVLSNTQRPSSANQQKDPNYTNDTNPRARQQDNECPNMNTGDSDQSDDEDSVSTDNENDDYLQNTQQQQYHDSLSNNPRYAATHENSTRLNPSALAVSAGQTVDQPGGNDYEDAVSNNRELSTNIHGSTSGVNSNYPRLSNDSSNSSTYDYYVDAPSSELLANAERGRNSQISLQHPNASSSMQRSHLIAKQPKGDQLLGQNNSRDSTDSKTRQKCSHLSHHNQSSAGLFNSNLDLTNSGSRVEYNPSVFDQQDGGNNENRFSNAFDDLNDPNNKEWSEKVNKEERQKEIDRIGKAQIIHYSPFNPKLIWSKIARKTPNLPPPVSYDSETSSMIINQWDGTKTIVKVLGEDGGDSGDLNAGNTGPKHDINGSVALYVDSPPLETNGNREGPTSLEKTKLPGTKIFQLDSSSLSEMNQPTIGNIKSQNNDTQYEAPVAFSVDSPSTQSVSHNGDKDMDKRLLLNLSSETQQNQPSDSNLPTLIPANNGPSIRSQSPKPTFGKLPESNTFKSTNISSSSLPVINHADTFKNNEKPRTKSLASLYNNYMELDNVQGFVGLAALALAEVPSPKTLLKRTQWKYNNWYDEEMGYNDLENGRAQDGNQLDTGRRSYEPSAAAGVRFKREHTRGEIMHRRFKAIRYLLIEYCHLGVRYVLTLKGFIITIYFMLIVAFGGMLFLLLCNAAPAMTKEWGPDDKVHSPRQIWMEIDSQILNALFCVTGLGLFPVRTRDFYFYCVGHWGQDTYCWTKLAGYHNNWFLPSYTKNWKLLMIVLLYIMNSVFQVLLCVAMWKYNILTRPSWVTGTLIAASFSCVIIAGIIMFLEAKKIKTLYIISNGEKGACVVNPGKNEKHDN